MAKGQAEALVPLLEQLLEQAGKSWAALDAIGVGVGPGNFTGIRLSVATARGLALGLGKPAIGVTVFEARAHTLPRPLLVAEDARRGEVYVMAFDENGVGEALLLDPSDGAALGNSPVTGSGAALWASHAQVPVLPQPIPLAVAIAQIASHRLTTPQPRPAPFYLRAADAAPPSDPPPVILP